MCSSGRTLHGGERTTDISKRNRSWAISVRKLRLKLIKECKRFMLEFHQWIALSDSTQIDIRAQVIHAQQMFLPELIDFADHQIAHSFIGRMVLSPAVPISLVLAGILLFSRSIFSLNASIIFSEAFFPILPLLNDHRRRSLLESSRENGCMSHWRYPSGSHPPSSVRLWKYLSAACAQTLSSSSIGNRHRYLQCGGSHCGKYRSLDAVYSSHHHIQAYACGSCSCAVRSVFALFQSTYLSMPAEMGSPSGGRNLL